jgi:hypothetical protein
VERALQESTAVTRNTAPTSQRRSAALDSRIWKQRPPRSPEAGKNASPLSKRWSRLPPKRTEEAEDPTSERTSRCDPRLLLGGQRQRFVVNSCATGPTDHDRASLGISEAERVVRGAIHQGRFGRGSTARL